MILRWCMVVNIYRVRVFPHKCKNRISARLNFVKTEFFRRFGIPRICNLFLRLEFPHKRERTNRGYLQKGVHAMCMRWWCNGSTSLHNIFYQHCVIVPTLKMIGSLKLPNILYIDNFLVHPPSGGCQRIIFEGRTIKAGRWFF